MRIFTHLPYLTLPYLTSPHLTLPHLTSPRLTSPRLTSPYLTSPLLTLPYLTLPDLTSPHLTSPHLTSPYLAFTYLPKTIMTTMTYTKEINHARVSYLTVWLLLRQPPRLPRHPDEENQGFCLTGSSCRPHFIGTVKVTKEQPMPYYSSTNGLGLFSETRAQSNRTPES